MLGLPSSQREIYGNDESGALPVDDHGQTTKPKSAQANTDIEEKDLQVLRVCFEEDSDPSFKFKEGLALTWGLAVGRVDNWYRKQRLARPGSIPYIRMSSSPQDVPGEETGDEAKALLNYCFDKDSDPLFEEKERLARILGTTIEDIDEWHRKKRLASQANLLSSLNLDDELGPSQIDRTGQRPVNGRTTGNDASKRLRSRSTVSIRNSRASASFSQRTRLGLDAGSESSQTTAPSSSSPTKTPRYKCTSLGCPRVCNSIADQVRHEYEVHWRELYFPCILCSMDLAADGLFECTFCGELFRELVAIEQHILGPCNLPKVVKASHHRFAHAEGHQKRHHPSTSEARVNGQNYLKCFFCTRKFNRNDDPKGHHCDGKRVWKGKQDIKALFEAEGELTLWSEKGLKGWSFRVEGGYPSPWPRECSFEACSKTFDSLRERAVHFDEAHYVPSQTHLKRGFSDSGIDYDGEDGDGRTENSPSQHGGSSTTERRWRRRHQAQQPVQLSDEVRRMDLVGVVDERLPTNLS
jgi:hypothetical protein